MAKENLYRTNNILKVASIKEEIENLLKNYSLENYNKLKNAKSIEIEKEGNTKNNTFIMTDLYYRNFRDEDWYKKLSENEKAQVEINIANYIHKTTKKYLPNIYKEAIETISKISSNNKDIINAVKDFKEKIGFTPGFTSNKLKKQKANCADFANFVGNLYKLYGYKIREFDMTGRISYFPGHVAMGIELKQGMFISDINFYELLPFKNWINEMKSEKWFPNFSAISHMGGVSGAGVHFNLGFALGGLKRYDEVAEEEYREAIRLNPNFAGAHNNLGVLLDDLKRFEEAEKEFREAIRINPNYAGAHNNLGILLADLKRFEEAEKEYRETIRIDPNLAEAHYNLGLLLYNLKRYDEAEKEFREAIRVDPNDYNAHNNLGNLLVNLKRYEEAEKEYRKAIRINPNDAEAHNKLIELYKRTNHGEPVIKVIKI